ncbi:MAG TPA: DivIVA domain-containing protein [Acidimicrobiales bacterium]|nr:DivIVA domain-containing protein [Acidimicrobiales bacterium]
MDNGPSTHSILDTLRTVEFRLGLKGYNVDEVDEYLEKAAVEAEQVQDRLRTANERLRQATERIAQLEVDLQHAPADRSAPAQPPAATAQSAPGASGPGVSDDTLQRTLLLAQKFVDQTKRESEAEAAQVVGRAEERARTMLAQAEERARQLTTEAEERLRDEVSRLEEARTRLVSDVEAMTKHLEEQRTKIRASLTDALRWVDERMATEEAKSPAGGAASPAKPETPAAPAPSSAPAGSAGPAAPGGHGGPGGVVGAGGGPLRPGATGAPGSTARPASPSVPQRPEGTPAPDRAHSPVGAHLGVLNGGLFETSGDDTAGG